MIWRIIEGYTFGSIFIGWFIIESDLLITVKSFSMFGKDISQLGCLVFYFLNNIDASLVSFTHVYMTSNCLTYLIAKDALVLDDIWEWTSDILFLLFMYLILPLLTLIKYNSFFLPKKKFSNSFISLLLFLYFMLKD